MHSVTGKIVLLLVCILTSICFVSYFWLFTHLKHAVKLSDKIFQQWKRGLNLEKKAKFYSQIFNHWTKKHYICLFEKWYFVVLGTCSFALYHNTTGIMPNRRLPVYCLSATSSCSFVWGKIGFMLVVCLLHCTVEITITVHWLHM